MEVKLLDEYLDRGYSLIPLLQNSKRPAMRWKRYQYERATKEAVQEWNVKGWNIGIVTGKISHLAVVDVDDIAVLDELSEKLPEIKETARAKTRKGYHFHFKCKTPLSPKYNFLDLPKVELKGEGSYVVAPQSVVEDKVYNWEIPLNNIILLPDWIIEEQRRRITVDLDISECPSYYGRVVLCIKQILNVDIEKGYRDQSLFILYNLLLKKRNSKDYAQKIVRSKNQSLKNPLSEIELKKIFKGDYRNMGCGDVLSRLSFIKCEGCKYQEKRVRKMRRELLLLNSDKLRDLEPGEFKALCFLDTHYERKEIPTVRELADVVKMSKSATQRALDGLKKKGIKLEEC